MMMKEMKKMNGTKEVARNNEEGDDDDDEMKKTNGTKEVARNVITDKVKKMIETKQVSR